MAELMVDLVYGNALYQAARDTDKVTLISEEAGELLGILDNEPELSAFLNSPAIAATAKKDIIGNIFEGKICDELLNFIYILIDKGRTRHFARIIGAYRDLMNKASGFAYGKILSVGLLSVDRLEKFEQETGKLLKLNVKLENFSTPDLIGGVKIFVDGKVIDASVKSRLKDLKNSLEQ